MIHFFSHVQLVVPMLKHPKKIIIFIFFFPFHYLATSSTQWLIHNTKLRAGLKVLPHNAKMHYNFGNFLRDSAEHELAIKHYHEALRLWPSYASAHNNLGTLLDSPEMAEQHFLAAIRYSSEHINAHYNLGRLYRWVCCFIFFACCCWKFFIHVLVYALLRMENFCEEKILK